MTHSQSLTLAARGKHRTSATLAATLLVCGAAFGTAALAQAPMAATSQMSPNGGMAQDVTSTGKDKRAANMGTNAADRAAAQKMMMDMEPKDMPMTTRMKVMDTNGDGMISRREYDQYHAMMWRRMKTTNGMIPMADMQDALRGGAN
jgi:hypothetical protein